MNVATKLSAPIIGFFGRSMVLIAVACGCSEQRPPVSRPIALPPRLESYFEQYCDYTGSLGIGFVESDTYDYRFRQHLKKTQDPELKRLFVLQHLHREVDLALWYLEAGIIMTGKTSSRPLTLAEWQATRQRILAQVEDLATYVGFTNFAPASSFATSSFDTLHPSDPEFDACSIRDLRARIRSITNAPAAVTNSPANGGRPIRPETNQASSTAGSRR